MKNLKQWMIIVSLCLTSYSFASHCAGGYFEYKCLGNNDYEIIFTLMRDCDGAPHSPTMTFDITNSCNTACGTLSYVAPDFYTHMVNYGCPTQCLDDGPIMPLENPSFQIIKYRVTIHLPYECADWKISSSVPNRNSVDFVDPVGSQQEYYNYCIINNTNGNCRSSVEYSGIPMAMGCAENLGSSMYHVANPNGTTLVYSLVTPKAGTCLSNGDMAFVGGTSALRPHPALEDFSLNGSNGEFSFFATLQGKSYFALKVQEYDGTTLLGETLLDGITYVGASCDLGSTVDFSDWSNENSNTFTVTEVDKQYCKTVTLQSNGNGEDLQNIVVFAPPYVTSTILSNHNGTAVIKLCATFPIETLCSNTVAAITITAQSSDAGCVSQLNGSGHKGYYYIQKTKGQYCPENLYFTNRNPVTGNLMPAYAKAEERIWIGDKMPQNAPQEILDNQGPVVITQDSYFTAGIEVVLPSCWGTGCVTISATTTIELKPNSCSADCDQIPLAISVKERFNCNGERLIAIATGDGPFTYHWNVNGNTFVTTDAILEIHNIVSLIDGGSIPYTVEVFDAVGQSGTYSGEILGTKRFYQNIQQNTKYYDFANNTVNGPDGYYYGASIYVKPSHPAYIWDDVNAGPPWYGATHMDLVVWGSNGQVIYEKDKNLEGAEDWSFDNGEFYWNGHHNNSMSQPCAYTATGASIFNYRLIARNCYPAEHQEDANFRFVGVSPNETVGCTEQDDLNDYLDTVKVAKSVTGNDGGVYNDGVFENRVDNLPGTGETLYIQCVPNPARTVFEIRSNQSEFHNVHLLDQTGKSVMNFSTLAAGEKIDVRSLSGGIYILVLEGHHIKLIKE